MSRVTTNATTRVGAVLLALLVAACAGGGGGSPAPSSSISGPASARPSEASPAAPTDPSSPAAPTDGASPAVPTDAPTSPEPVETSGGPPSAVDLRLEPFVEGLSSPVFVTSARDGSGLLYVVEQDGRILVVERDGTVRPEPFLDISERITAGGEQGLLGLAFHPDYAENGRFFVMYTAAGDGANTVSEFAATTASETADAGSERVLLAIEDFAGNHNGGMIAFGSDGHLHIGTGDGGGGGDPAENGQDPGALLGKLLRIDVDTGSEGPYAIPADNPFVDTDGYRAEIWALGLRNPWRFTFDRETGDLFIGDVGQGLYEEIDAAPAGIGGLNFGWSVMEGPECFREPGCDQTGLTLPVVAYGRDEGSVVIGGYVYRGSAIPELVGTYLYADIAGPIWGIDAATAIATGGAEPRELHAGEGSIVAFGEDEDGELLIVDLGGRISRLVSGGG
jgi:glucose/arabinose dehydrogenase